MKQKQKVKRNRGKRFHFETTDAKKKLSTESSNPFNEIAKRKEKKEKIGREKLLKEYRKTAKQGGIMDNRVGESNMRLTKEQKMQARYQMEKLSGMRKKKDIFSLDEDEEEMKLTHMGKDVNEIDDFNERIDDESDEEHNLNADVVNNLHFSTEDDINGGNRYKKSKKEIYDEIILKSKVYKAQRVKEKQENDLLIDKLDNEFSELLPLLNKNKRQKVEDDKADDYDKSMQLMKGGTRAYSTPKPKSDKEVALGKKKELERLEALRREELGKKKKSNNKGDRHVKFVDEQNEEGGIEEDEFLIGESDEENPDLLLEEKGKQKKKFELNKYTNQNKKMELIEKLGKYLEKDLNDEEEEDLDELNELDSELEEIEGEEDDEEENEGKIEGNEEDSLDESDGEQ